MVLLKKYCCKTDVDKHHHINNYTLSISQYTLATASFSYFAKFRFSKCTSKVHNEYLVLFSQLLPRALGKSKADYETPAISPNRDFAHIQNYFEVVILISVNN
jgi:hypothetical protein